MHGINTETLVRRQMVTTLHSFCRSALFIDSRDSRVGAEAIGVGRGRMAEVLLSGGYQPSSVCSIVPPGGTDQPRASVFHAALT